MPRLMPETIGTKIIATLGPASSDEQMLGRLIEDGVGVFRLNFSHGTLAEHERTLAGIRRVTERKQQPIAVLGDLSGPKIRLGRVAVGAEPGSGAAAPHLEPGSTLIIQRDPIEGDARRVSTTYPQLIEEIEPGHRVLIDDGNIRLIVIDKSDEELTCQCLHGGSLSSGKGVNLPDTPLSIDPLTEHDHRCAEWAVEHELDWLALSFVRRAEDLKQLRDLISASIPIVAKIEKPEAVKQIDPIIETADAVMIARGDLGVEMDVARVPIIQKDIIRRCGTAGTPVIVATQMLQSMTHSPAPTRAEVSDVANAIFDGTDAAMLSGETAVGQFPLLAVQQMRRVADQTERYLLEMRRAGDHPMPELRLREQDAALARAAWQMAHSMELKAVVVWSESGRIARIFSKLRIGVPVIALSDDPAAVRRMNLLFGIDPHRMDVPQSIIELAPHVDRMLRQQHWLHEGDAVLIIGGTTLGQPGQSNAILVHRIGVP